MTRKHSIGTKAYPEEAHSDYVGSVYWYTRRNLSFGGDALNAFTGISQILLKRMAEGLGEQVNFVYGLPSHMLDWALLWQPETVSHRRFGGWPSWSWCGWTGGAINSLGSLQWDALQQWSREHTWISWEMFSDDGKTLRRRSSSVALANQHERFHSLELPKACVAERDAAVRIESSDLATQSQPLTLSHPAWNAHRNLLPVLHFSTLVVHLHLQTIDNFTSKQDNQIDRCYRILSAGTHAGAIWINPNWKFDQAQAHEMLLLSDARLNDIHKKARPDIQPRGEEWDDFHVMLVDQDSGLDIRERVAIGILSQSAFDPTTASASAWQEVWLR